ncbi:MULTISPECIES: DUF6879 family protein [Streptomyces]|uniref:DUF6879 family protein n=1 Tax=Streptomyces TaxID=1883 RepID=UPI00055C6C9F|nr:MULTISPECIES: DUF6879 family protein [Streptomyces]AOW87550.1 hypothetical protein BC342_14460 [Streptomyces olivaceus]MBZ6111066.1 hypothetical protein [Streptomyces olivaceus]MBZ6126433.1 hypothetical protein [Streptomyces olivaceus]MBZ6145403.1 hypothetical protein [Streptomyces olivaceus]MBZ6159591.1 hypothetical protein [Streptomyces olivaceus]
MTRRLRFNGTGSGVTGCPSVHEDLDTGEVIVHGPPLTEQDDLTQLQHLSEGEVAVVVPRDLLVDWTPKERTRKVRTIDLDEFGSLFGKYEHTAWRLETRRRYASDEKNDRWTRFVSTGETGDDWADAAEVRQFRDTVRAQTQQGKRMERVRIVDQPASLGQRYLLNCAKGNIGFGEDIRNLWRVDADRLRLPAEDFWLFDSRLVALLQFDHDDELTHVDLITEPAEVVRCCMIRDAAWHHAVPWERFTAEMNGDA